MKIIKAKSLASQIVSAILGCDMTKQAFREAGMAAQEIADKFDDFWDHGKNFWDQDKSEMAPAELEELERLEGNMITVQKWMLDNNFPEPAEFLKALDYGDE